MQPRRAARMAEALVAKIPADIRRHSIDVVVSPAMGGVIIGHEMGRALDLDALFLERPEGTFELRRGFRLEEGQKVLMMEDVVTTGLSSREAIQAIREAGGDVIAAGASGGPFQRRSAIRCALLSAQSPSTCHPTPRMKYRPNSRPVPTTKPGSRKS